MKNYISSKIIIAKFCILFFLFCFFCVNAQDIDSIKQNFPGAHAAYLTKEVHAFYDKKGESISLQTKNKATTLFLDDNANLYTDENIYYSELMLAENVDAKTIIVDDKKEKIFRSYKIIDKHITRPGIFYDDLRVKEIVFPNIKKGAKAVLSFDNIYLEPRLFSPIMLSSTIPVIEFVYKVTAHKDIKIKYHYIGIEESKLNFSMVVKGDQITYTWVMKNIPARKYVSHGPGPLYYEPQIVVYVAELTVKDKKINFSADRQGLANWNSKFLTNINKNSNIKLKPVIDSIIKGASSDFEKSQKIFYWVQDNIRYIAFENGYGGYIPRDADEVYAKRYGDCKDMENLITILHKIAGIEAYHTWIGTRDIPYKIDSMPMPCDFNHMISTVRVDDKWYFLDATGRNIPYGFPTSMIQSKEALISISKDSSILLNVPEVDCSRNLTKDEIELTLKGNIIEGAVSKTLTGFSMTSALLSLLYKTTEAKEIHLKELLSLGNNKCRITNIKLPVNETYKSPEYTISYDFFLPDYLLNLPSEIYINLNLQKDLSENKIDALTRKVDYKLEFKNSIHQKVILNIPEGYTINYTPKNYIFEDTGFGFDISYEQIGNKIIMNKKLYANFLLLTPDKFNKWNQMIDKLNKAYKETVSLKKI